MGKTLFNIGRFITGLSAVFALIAGLLTALTQPIAILGVFISAIIFYFVLKAKYGK